MVKHTQKISQQFGNEWFEFDHFVRSPFKGLTDYSLYSKLLHFPKTDMQNSSASFRRRCLQIF